MPFTKKCTYGSAPLNKMASRALDKKYLYSTSPEILVQIQNNFPESIIMMASVKIVQQFC